MLLFDLLFGQNTMRMEAIYTRLLSPRSEAQGSKPPVIWTMFRLETQRVHDN